MRSLCSLFFLPSLLLRLRLRLGLPFVSPSDSHRNVTKTYKRDRSASTPRRIIRRSTYRHIIDPKSSERCRHAAFLLKNATINVLLLNVALFQVGRLHNSLFPMRTSHIIILLFAHCSRCWISFSTTRLSATTQC